MPDVEKVIKGLGEALTLLAEYVPCEGYLGYAPGACLDAIDLLKAQEPRVMTLEEVKQWCEIHPHKQTPIWVEFQHGHGTDGWRVGLVNSGLLAWCKDNEARCWTSRPTDEQREATPWNG